MPTPGKVTRRVLLTLIFLAILTIGAINVLPARGSVISFVTAVTGLGEEDTPEKQGARLYIQYCVPCHGPGGDLIAATPLESKDYMSGFDDTKLMRTIVRGNGIMPGLGKEVGGQIGPDQAELILARLRSGPQSSSGKLSALPTASSRLKASDAYRQGMDIYAQYCLRCHGDQGDNVRNINLNSSEYLNKRGETALVGTIGQGKGAMPPFAKEKGGELSAENIAQVYAYLKSVAEGPTSGSSQKRQPPPEIPHTTQGREDKCLNCHQENMFTPVPVSHLGRTSEMCLYCHVMSGQAATTQAAGSSGSQPAQAPGTPPKLPHPIDGRENKCFNCHTVGGTPNLPAGHQGFTMNNCVGCHRS